MDTELWSNLPRELLCRVFSRLVSQICDLKVLSREWMEEVDNKELEFNRFLAEVPKPTMLGRIGQGMDKSWFSLYDLKTRKRKRNFIEIPLKWGSAFDADGGLVCLYSSSKISGNKMIVLNPLTKQMRQLPPLLIRSEVVLIKLEVNRESKQYKLFVVVYDPSDPCAREVIVQVYSSQTKEWAIMKSSEQRNFVGYHYMRFQVVYCVYNCAKGRLQHFNISDIVQRDVWEGHVSFHQDRMFVMEKDTRGRFVRYQIDEYKLLENESGWVQVATHSCDEVLQGFYLVPLEDWEVILNASEGFLFLCVQLTAAARARIIFPGALCYFAWLYELSTDDWLEVPAIAGDRDNFDMRFLSSIRALYLEYIQ